MKSRFVVAAMLLAAGLQTGCADPNPPCNDGSGSGTFTLGSGGAVSNGNDAYRFRAKRNNAGNFSVTGWLDGSGQWSSYNQGTSANTWVGWWSTNTFVNSETVNNNGAGASFDYERTCTRV